ncbi:hypothetical protein KKA14_05925 [bacterium]|nr:hypothetical protein [bacterium]
MISKTIKKISNELENLVKHQISVERALDLMEASTHDLEELVAINTMRESLCELSPAMNARNLFIFPELMDLNTNESVFLA